MLLKCVYTHTYNVTMEVASPPKGKVNGYPAPSKSEWMEDGHHKLLNPTEIRNTNVYDRFVYPQYLCGVIPIYTYIRMA